MTPANPAARKASALFFPAESPPVVRPRQIGVTHILDRLHGLDPDELRPLAPYMDVVKIGWGLPLILPREEVRKRIQFYHSLGVEVSTGGTLLEHAVTRNQSEVLMDEARGLGFDIIEISDGIIELSHAQITELAEQAQKRRLGFYIEVGKKNPQNQLSLRETLDRIGRALELKPRKVIIESRESGRGVGIYDGEGTIKWDWVRSIVADYPAEDLIFEAPIESQQ
ncbi:MAG: phosphosulfolactate synthase, partial [Thermoplasmata archaeon]|nr:phosphosulfolactate synthase [Thermoplasmata archaeon]